MARPPASLPPTTDRPLAVSLILGSFVHDPVKYDLFDLYVPASSTPAPHPDEALFYALPTIAHTFRPEQKLPPKLVSTVFAALVLSPWAVLLGLVRRIVVGSPTNLLTFPPVGKDRSERSSPGIASHLALHCTPGRLRGAACLVLGGS
jgi:hypothetical protein